MIFQVHKSLHQFPSFLENLRDDSRLVHSTTNINIHLGTESSKI